MIRLLNSLTGCFFLLALIGACSSKPFNFSNNLREQINSLEQAVNSGESDVLMAVIAKDFSAEYFTDRRQLKIFLLRQRSQFNRVTSTSGPVQVHVQFAKEVTTAKASFKTLLTGSQNWLPETGQLYQFETSWRWLDGGDAGEKWELIHASWEPVFD